MKPKKLTDAEIVKNSDDTINHTKRGYTINDKTFERKIVLQKAILTYGKENQVDMAIEEMSELTKALLKERRNEKEKVTKSAPPLQYITNIIEEIADVEIMLEQLKMLFDCGGLVDRVKDYKIERLKARLNNADNS